MKKMFKENKEMSAYTEEIKPIKPYGAFGMWQIVGLLLFFNIPVVGWIACIVTAIFGKNINTRNLARATLVFIVVATCALVLLYHIAMWVIGSMVAVSSDSVDGFMMNFYQLTRYAKLFSLGDIVYIFSA